MTTVTGTSGNDSWAGLGPTIRVDALAGNDRAAWTNGATTGSGAQMGLGADTVQISGADRVRSTGGVFAGGDGNDDLRNDSDDRATLDGGAGNDSLYSSANSLGDVLIGGAGNDFFAVKDTGVVVSEDANGGSDTVQCNTEFFNDHGPGGVTLVMAGGSTGGLAGLSSSVYGVDADVERVKAASALSYKVDFVGNGGANFFDAQTAGAAPGGVDAYGQGGNDTLFGGDVGGDRLFGGDGNDAINGRYGRDHAEGGAGNDTIYVDGGAAYGGTGDDVITGGTDGGTYDGGDGHDRLTGSESGDVLYGGAGRDVISGGLGSDVIYDDGDGGVIDLGSGALSGRTTDVLNLSGLTGTVQVQLGRYSAYKTTADTVNVAAADDGARLRLADFQHGTDRVDLSAALAGHEVTTSIVSGQGADGNDLAIRDGTTGESYSISFVSRGDVTADFTVGVGPGHDIVIG